MIILDTNIFIYLTDETLPTTIVADSTIAHASVTKIEALGYARIEVNQLLLLERLFKQSRDLPLTDVVIDKAVELRQLKRMSLGDAIIAATALTHDAPLWTANTEDFKHVDGLKLVNPLLK